MRLDQRQVKEKRLLSRLFYILKSLLQNQVGRVDRSTVLSIHHFAAGLFLMSGDRRGIDLANALIVIQERRIITMSVSLAVIPKELLKALPQWAARRIGRSQSPFAEARSRVTGLLQQFRKRHCLLGKRPLAGKRSPVARVSVASDFGMGEVLPRHQHAARRGAGWRAAVVLRQPHPLTRQLVQMRRENLFLAVTPQLTIPQIIGQDKDNIRSLVAAFLCRPSCFIRRCSAAA